MPLSYKSPFKHKFSVSILIFTLFDFIFCHFYRITTLRHVLALKIRRHYNMKWDEVWFGKYFFLSFFFISDFYQWLARIAFDTLVSVFKHDVCPARERSQKYPLAIILYSRYNAVVNVNSVDHKSILLGIRTSFIVHTLCPSRTT